MTRPRPLLRYYLAGGGGPEDCTGQALQYATAAGHARLSGPLEGGRGFALNTRASDVLPGLELSDQGSRSNQQPTIKIQNQTNNVLADQVGLNALQKMLALK